MIAPIRARSVVRRCVVPRAWIRDATERKKMRLAQGLSDPPMFFGDEFVSAAIQTPLFFPKFGELGR